MKGVALFACLCLTLHGTFCGRAQQLSLQTFDTISIRPSIPGDDRFGCNPNPNDFSVKGAELRFLIQLAYGANADDIIDVPPAFRSAKFDIHAKSDVDPSSPAAKLSYSSDEGQKVFEARLQSLLAERFQLKLHHATAERQVLYLEATKHPRLQPEIKLNPMQTLGNGYLKLDATDMDGLAKALTDRLSTNVLNHTDLLGVYALEVKWDVRDRAEALGYPFEAVSDALTDQLGLKLVPAKASVPVLAIDNAKMPPPN